jgi:uracil-DNA glycosylase
VSISEKVPMTDNIKLDDMIYCTACKLAEFNDTPIVPKSLTKRAFILFIGENPSKNKDQNEPFGSNTISGDALEKFYLDPLGLSRDQVWITNLIKCRYPKGKKIKNTEKENMAQTCGRLWLAKEIAIVSPYLIVTLSDKEVFARFKRIFGINLRMNFDKAAGQPHEIGIQNNDYILFPLIHPDISRPEGYGDSRKLIARRKWSRLHIEHHIPRLKEILMALQDK